jgi:hypothetical protein
LVEGGIEFKVKTTQIFNSGSGIVETIVDVLKDPAGLFTPCDCPGVFFSLSSMNCTITYAFDECTNACNDANNLQQGITTYDPKSDEIYSAVTVMVLGVPVDQVAVFVSE